MTNYINTTQPNNLYPVANATTTSTPFVDEFMTRDPTVNDINYPIQKKWLNTATGAFWELQNFSTVQGVTTANWILIGKHAAVTETLTGNTGGPVPPTGNNINVLGDGTFITVVGNPGTSTLTIEPAGGLATLYTEDTGTAVPSAGNLNVLGTTGITTTGAGNTITIETDGTVATSYVENAGSATPAAGILNVLGTGGITTSGAGHTITIDGSGVVADLKIHVDAHTAPGTNPVVPDASGNLTVTGGQVVAGTTANVIETNSLAANAFTIDIQRSQAVASSTVGDNGVSHFDSGIFSVDANAFVSLATGFYQTGTWTPVLSFGGASVGITYSLQSGVYARIGKLIFVNFNVTLTSKGASTGTALISGLPFTVASPGVQFSYYMSPGTFPANTIDIFASVPSGTAFDLIYLTSTSAVGTLTDTAFANNTTFVSGGCYLTT
jgi:hypothetical protein